MPDPLCATWLRASPFSNLFFTFILLLPLLSLSASLGQRQRFTKYKGYHVLNDGGSAVLLLHYNTSLALGYPTTYV